VLEQLAFSSIVPREPIGPLLLNKNTELSVHSWYGTIFGKDHLTFLHFGAGRRQRERLRCTWTGAFLFESIAAEIISAMLLGGSMAKYCKLKGQFPYRVVCRC
jgi:hypothetical protein